MPPPATSRAEAAVFSRSAGMICDGFRAADAWGDLPGDMPRTLWETACHSRRTPGHCAPTANSSSSPRQTSRAHARFSDYMDDPAPQENPPADFNKLDLSQLQGFSFGTQWTQSKSSPAERRQSDPGGERPRRDDRRDGPGGSAPDRRDRRPFHRPAGPGEGQGGGGVPVPAGGAPERREFSGGPRPRRDEGGGDYRGGPRRDGPRYGGRGEQYERGPYESPYFAATFYPEDTSFNTLVQTIRKSCRTIELFEIARTVVAKTERFVVVVTRKSLPEAPTSAPAAGAEPAVRPAKAAFYISVPDHLPFESDEAAVAHVLAKNLGLFFDMAEVEVDPPKGNFQVINKCGVTGELLGPPNYHRYNQIVQQHHAAKVARMAFEAFRSRIETIRDPEVVKQWLEKMKKTTRYTWKLSATAKPAETPTVVAAEVKPAEATAEAPVEAPASEAARAAPVELTPAPAAPTFDSFDDARLYLLTHARDKVVRTAESARFHGTVAETMPPGEIRRAIEGALERQRKFPLDTANALRGRLRREHFTIFKKGSKGVSYVCAVKRKFRVPGQTFADTIGALISFIEANPMIRASELPVKFLGIAFHVPATPPPEGAPAPAEPTLSIDERAKISRLQGDLMWLVHEGYVTEFIDGRLFAPPPMVEARKKEIETEEHDPENFPEVPSSAPPFEEKQPAPAPVVAEAAPAGAPPEAPALQSQTMEPPVAEPPAAVVPVVEPPPAEPPKPAAE
jgi:hypothetical protein